MPSGVSPILAMIRTILAPLFRTWSQLYQLLVSIVEQTEHLKGQVILLFVWTVFGQVNASKQLNSLSDDIKCEDEDLAEHIILNCLIVADLLVAEDTHENILEFVQETGNDFSFKA